MRTSRKPPFKRKKAFALVVDGECESCYALMIKRNEREIRFDLKPTIPQKKSLDEQYEIVKGLVKGGEYDKVFWVLDYDTILSETRVAKADKQSPQQFLDKCIKEIEKEYKNKVVVIRNNPCLEYWLLLHFEGTSAGFHNCEEASKRLKKHLPTYKKTREFYTKQNNDIYLQLKPHLQTAIANAKKVSEAAKGNSNATISEMYFLFEALGLVEKHKKK